MSVLTPSVLSASLLRHYDAAFLLQPMHQGDPGRSMATHGQRLGTLLEPCGLYGAGRQEVLWDDGKRGVHCVGAEGRHELQASNDAGAHCAVQTHASSPLCWCMDLHCACGLR